MAGAADRIRNVAIVAHVDHGKTKPVTRCRASPAACGTAMCRDG